MMEERLDRARPLSTIDLLDPLEKDRIALAGVCQEGAPGGPCRGPRLRRLARVPRRARGRSEASRRARRRRAHLHRRPPSGPEGYNRPHVEVEELGRDRSRAILDDALKALPAVVRPEGRLLSGEVEEQLVEQANASLDVMVVGSRAYGPLLRARRAVP